VDAARPAFDVCSLCCCIQAQKNEKKKGKKAAIARKMQAARVKSSQQSMQVFAACIRPSRLCTRLNFQQLTKSWSKRVLGRIYDGFCTNANGQQKARKPRKFPEATVGFWQLEGAADLKTHAECSGASHPCISYLNFSWILGQCCEHVRLEMCHQN
jgi:hypothetical protein